jgi:hypothetical protein
MPKVTKTRMNMLNFGDQTIQYVKYRLPFGAGNQQWDLIRGGAQQVSDRAGAAQTLTTSLQNGDPNLVSARKRSGAALTYGAGNCQEQAAVAYTYMRRMSPEPAYWFHYIACHQWKHVFAAISEDQNIVADRTVIVDPWPANAQAVRWEDHFCYGAPITPLRSKQGKWEITTPDEAMAKYYFGLSPAPQFMFPVDTAAYAIYWCSKNQQFISYTV